MKSTNPFQLISLNIPKTFMERSIISFVLFSSLLSHSQINSWNENEKAQYKKLLNLAMYVNKKEKHQISKDTLFKKYIFFDYVLNDTILERKEKRLESFDTIFYSFRKTIDSFGIENLDAKPIRFYKSHKIYEPFKEDLAKESISGEKMYYKKDSNVFAYYQKKDSKKPLGTLLFDPKTNKLVSWVMIDQGGYKYFLIFNLL